MADGHDFSFVVGSRGNFWRQDVLVDNYVIRADEAATIQGIIWQTPRQRPPAERPSVPVTFLSLPNFIALS